MSTRSATRSDVILLISTILGGLVAWFAAAIGVAVSVGRMCARRDEQVCVTPDGSAPRQQGRSRSEVPVRPSAEVVEPSGS